MKTHNEVNNLTRKINSIFEQVYSINESISVDEKRQLVLGFEDGINELFGGLGKFGAKVNKFFKSTTDKAKSTYDSMVNKGKEYYEKGKQLAGDAWNSMINFGKKVLTRIEQGYNKAVDLVISNYNSFVEAVKNTYQQAVDLVIEAYDKMKSKAEAFEEYFKGLYNDVLAKTTKLIADTKRKMMETGDKVNNWIQANKESITKNKEMAKQSGIDAMRQLSEMVSNVLEKSKKGAGEIASIAFFICVAPIVLLIEGVKKIPTIYNSAIEITKKFVQDEIADIKTQYQDEMTKESFRHIKTFESFKY